MKGRDKALRLVLLSAILVLLALALSGCTQEITAYVVNPCDSELAIATYDADDPALMLPRNLSKQVRLSPLSVTEVPGAFQYWGGPKSWLVGVEGTTDYVLVNGDTWVNNTVVIPARFCAPAPAAEPPTPAATTG